MRLNIYTLDQESFLDLESEIWESNKYPKAWDIGEIDEAMIASYLNDKINNPNKFYKMPKRFKQMVNHMAKEQKELNNNG